MVTKTLGKLFLIQPNNYPHQDHDHPDAAHGGGEGGIGVDVCVPEVFIPVTAYPGPDEGCLPLTLRVVKTDITSTIVVNIDIKTIRMRLDREAQWLARVRGVVLVHRGRFLPR